MLEIMQFLKDNPNPSDADVHQWAEENGMNVEEVEENIYKLAASLVGDFFNKGLAYEVGLTEDDVDSEELKMGIEIEMEHTSNPLISKRIAMDHLAEIPDYYTRLVKMESEAGKEME